MENLNESIRFSMLKPYRLVRDIRFNQSQKKPLLIIYFSENSCLLDDYETLNIPLIDIRNVVIPVTRIPRVVVDGQKKIAYKQKGLLAYSDKTKTPKAKNLLVDLSDYLIKLEAELHLKNYRMRGATLIKDVIQRICMHYPEYDKILLYSVDVRKEFPKSILNRKIYPVLMDLKEQDFLFDDMLYCSLDEKNAYRLLMKDRSYNFSRIITMMRSIKPQKEISGADDVSEISEKVASEASSFVSIENKDKLVTIIQKYLTKDHETAEVLMFDDITPDKAKAVLIASAIYQTTGDVDKAKDEIKKMDKEKREVALKVIDKNFLDEVLPHKRAQNTSVDPILSNIDIPTIVDGKSPSHLFEKRSVDFDVNLTKDLTNSFKVLETKDIPLKIEKIDIVQKPKNLTELEGSYISTINVTMKDDFGKEHEVLIDIPTLDPVNGTFIINGRRKCLINQIILCPISFPKIYDSKFESSYSSFHIWAKKSRGLEYLEIYIGSFTNKIPIAIFLGFSFGFKESMKNYGIDYIFTSERPGKNEIFYKFLDDEYIVFKNVNTDLKRWVVNSFLYADIAKYNIEKEFGTVEYFNDIIIKMTGRVNSTYLIRSNLENIVDPVAKQVLINMNLPYRIFDIVKYMCSEVITGRVNDRNSLENQRIRGSEVIVHLVQKQLLAAYTTYKEQILSGNKNADFKVTQGKVLSDFINSEIVADMEYSNPIEEMAVMTRISPVGKSIGGVPNADTITGKSRNIHDSYFGNVDCVDTPEGATIGVLQQLTIDSYVTTARGLFKTKDKDDGENSGLLSTTSCMIPYVGNNEGARIMMACAQAKQALPLKNAQPPVVQSGYESILPQMLSDSFIKKSDVDGKIINITNSYITVESQKGIKKIPIEPKHLKSGTGKDTLSVFKPIVTVGQKVKPGQILAEGSCLSNGSIAMGATLCAAIMSYKGYNFEDGIVISESLAASEKMKSLHGISDDVVLSAKDRLLDIAKIGDFVERGKPLLRKSIGELEELLGFSDDEENVEITGGQLIKKSPGGRIVDIDIFSNVPKNTFPVLEELIEKTDKKYKREGKKRYTIRGQKIDGLMVRFEIQQELNTGLGDKMANRYGAKGIVSFVEKDEFMPVTPWGDRVEIIVNPIGILNRMNVGQLYEIYTGLISKLLAEKIKKSKNKVEIINIISAVISKMDNTKNKVYSKKFIENLTKMSESKIAAIVKDVNDKGFFPIIIPPFKSPTSDMIKDTIKFLGGKTGYELFLPEFNINTVRPVACGYMYFQKLEHMADMKIHARSVGPTTSKTMQPTGGKSRDGGQRIGELDSYAFTSLNATHVLAELYGPMSDDHIGKNEMISDIIAKGTTNFKQPRQSAALDLLNCYFKGLMLGE